MSKVILLPGIMGSELYRLRPPSLMTPDEKLWINPVALLAGGFADLQLDATGSAPGPLAGGAQIAHGIPLPQYYWPLLRVLQFAGYTVLARGYDWRLSIPAAAAAVWAEIQGLVGSDQVYFVAHSLGGLIARAIYQIMAAAGQAGQVARIITFGTPHYGSWATARIWWHVSHYYRWAVALAVLAIQPVVLLVLDYIDAVMASLPSMYEVMPFAASGPLFTQFPAQAALIYQPTYYVRPANAYIAPNRLLSAQQVQLGLGQLPPAGLVVSIAGTGYITPASLAPGGDPSTEGGYLTTASGDGTVTVAQSALAGAELQVVGGSHMLLPQIPAVQNLILSLLSGAGPADG